MSALAGKPDVEPDLPRPPLVTQNGTTLVWWTLSSGLVLMQRLSEHIPFNGLHIPTSILLDDQAGWKMLWNKCRHFRRYCSSRMIS
jgi:hypothetical protein